MRTLIISATSDESGVNKWAGSGGGGVIFCLISEVKYIRTCVEKHDI